MLNIIFAGTDLLQVKYMYIHLNDMPIIPGLMTYIQLNEVKTSDFLCSQCDCTSGKGPCKVRSYHVT